MADFHHFTPFQRTAQKSVRGHLTWANGIVPFAGRDAAGLLPGLKVAPCYNGDQGLRTVKQKLMIIWVGEKSQ